jgi:phosphomannomutase
MGFTHTFDATVLREYDIRGIVGKTLHAADAFAIGRCFATIVRRDGGRSIAVGYDGRLSSPELEAALVEGLKASGADVVRIGCGPTPMLYYTATTQPTDGAVMVTGSHNPPDYNGFKMMRGRKPFYGKQIVDLGVMAAAGDVVPEEAGNDRCRRRLPRASAAGLGRWRPSAAHCVGQRQWLGRRGSTTSGQRVARSPYRIERNHRRQVPGASS